MAGKKVAGRMGLTKAMRKAERLARQTDARKRHKAAQRAAYHSEFKREPGKRGYPRLKGKGKLGGIQPLGFTKGT